jgi:hypothetical protein
MPTVRTIARSERIVGGSVAAIAESNVSSVAQIATYAAPILFVAVSIVAFTTCFRAAARSVPIS